MKTDRQTDTIFAQSSAPGRAAIALHRLTGPESLSLISPYLFRYGEHIQAENYKLAPKTHFKHGESRYCILLDDDSEVLDDCMVTFFEGPKSYTGENTVEICIHGNPLISARLHSLLRTIGMREAKPGEFTQRAFLNGKIDLTRAEAVDQLIHAETRGAIQLARQASEGRITQAATALREQLTSVMSYFEAHIDFADDEVGSYDSLGQMNVLLSVKEQLEKLRVSYTVGLKIREGLRISLLGMPNAGKSSLYNALLRSERAIVTDIPGTTRDVLEDKLQIGGLDFVITDTAGIRDSRDPVEKIGVERSKKAAQNADILCLVISPNDLTLNHAEYRAMIADACEKLLNPAEGFSGKKIITVLTKSDGWTAEQRDELERIRADKEKLSETLVISSAANQEMEMFLKALSSAHNELTHTGRTREDAILISERQRVNAELAIQSIDEAIELVGRNDYPEKVASVLIQAARQIGDIVGEIGTDDVLEKIFSTFCIGK